MSDTEQAAAYVANARGLLDDSEQESVEIQRGAIKHAIEELRNARRAPPR